jgi:hypothetical protein
VFAAAGGPRQVLRLDNGLVMISQALQQFCDGNVGVTYISPGCPWANGYIESFNNRLRKECLNRNHWNILLEARVVIGDFKHEHNQRHPRLGPGLPNAGRIRCGVQVTPRSPAASTETGSNQSDSKTGWTQNWGLATLAGSDGNTGAFGQGGCAPRRPMAPGDRGGRKHPGRRGTSEQPNGGPTIRGNS